MTGLMTIDDLAARWQVDPKRAWKRAKAGGLRALNMGTEKYPEWRFRLAAVETWEAAVEREMDATEESPADEIIQDKSGRMFVRPKPPIGNLSPAPPPSLGAYRGRAKKS